MVEEICDSIAQDIGIAVSPEQKKLLASREKDILEGKVKTKTWGEIKKGISKRKAQYLLLVFSRMLSLICRMPLGFTEKEGLDWEMNFFIS